MKFGIVGGGVVGRATARAFMEHAEIRVYDTVKEKGTHTLTEVLDCDMVFVCLPTPQKTNSLECDLTVSLECDMTVSLECDLTAIHSFFQEVVQRDKCSSSFVLRSTVPIGTTRRLRQEYGLPNLIHSPEFLTARCSLTDAQIPARNIVGGKGIGEYQVSDECTEKLTALYLQRFPGVPCLTMTSDESEAVKLMLNSFFGVKVAFFNEMYALAKKFGLNWSVVMKGIMSDGRIAHSHTQVPGPDGKFGFGGECLPKDIASLIHQFLMSGVSPMVCLAAHTRNRYEDRERTL